MPIKPPVHQPAHAAIDRRAREREYDRRRAEDRAFYWSTRWRRLRASVLRENPLCVECDREERTTPAIDVDHRIPRRLRPDLAFDRKNLDPLCKTHHSRKTRQETGASRTQAQADGAEETGREPRQAGPERSGADPAGGIAGMP